MLDQLPPDLLPPDLLGPGLPAPRGFCRDVACGGRTDCGIAVGTNGVPEVAIWRTT